MSPEAPFRFQLPAAASPAAAGGIEPAAPVVGITRPREPGRRARRRWPRFSPVRVAAALSLLAGLALAGQGAFIYLKAALAQLLLERAFLAARAGGEEVRPWYYADMWPVARVSVPRLGASAVVLNSDSGQALAFGPGHVGGTAPPGEAGVSVIAAHRDTHFSFLGDVTHGDRIMVERSDGRTAVFVVRQTRVVRFDASGLDPMRPGRWLALSTCWPLDAKVPGPMRLVVEAEMVAGRS